MYSHNYNIKRHHFVSVFYCLQTKKISNTIRRAVNIFVYTGFTKYMITLFHNFNNEFIF